MNRYFLNIAAFFILLITPLLAWAQIPTGTPRTDDPFVINTTADIIIYLVLPLLVIVLFIFWWFFYKKPKEKEKENKGS
ncbi:hypothetical protein QWY93_03125 [Echinicola jeungdonensis]|uniref:Adenylosuccinate synthetase n=1 Tax=Echinicola jeungdonensis TaxID=709343 RepID=A0ABV5J151_9BACT|nr:hypothetical protein [Echinicola jeungdonensis]MDN3668320.1 hypothetical protein [Echinicola jeungdonensis]